MTTKATMARVNNIEQEKRLALIFRGQDQFSLLRADLSAQLIAARADAGLSQREVAEAVSSSQARVSYLERDMPHAVTLRTLFNQAQACGYDLQITLVKR